MKIKLPKKKTQKRKNQDKTRCGRRHYKGSHSICDVKQCKSNTKKKDVLKE